MKYPIFIIALLSFTGATASITIKNSKVAEVTIYRAYAKETRYGSTNIPAGNSEVVITNITSAIDENSIQVGCKNNVKILSVSSKLNYLPNESEVPIGKVKVWQDSIKWLDRQSRLLMKEKEAYEAELNLLNANAKLGSTTEGLKPSLLKELLELNRAKQLELKKILFDHDEKNTEIRNTIAMLQGQVNESTNRPQGKPIREIVLKVYSSKEVSTQFKVSYLVTQAGWTPTYEIRCENTTKPLALNCRAKIVQNTGFDWKDIRIKLSTANPNQNHNRPVLYPLFVDFMQPDYYRRRAETVSYGDGKKEADAPMSVQVANMAYVKDKNFVDGMKIDGNAVTIAENEILTEYDILQEQDIESDGQEHIIAIQELTIPATFNYHAVPKMDNGVFLLARITDWGKYNLLAGDATLFFDDMYVGKSYINPNVSADTLLISLGRDEKINIKRVKLNDLCVTKKFSNKKKETKAFETIVKNNKTSPVDIEVLDQYPVSRNSDIEVDLEEAIGAELIKEYGKVLWRIRLQPGETKKLKMVYTLKFPDDKAIIEKN
jgi:uncharacterized protein (TIGR02231 family)